MSCSLWYSEVHLWDKADMGVNMGKILGVSILHLLTYGRCINSTYSQCVFIIFGWDAYKDKQFIHDHCNICFSPGYSVALEMSILFR